VINREEIKIAEQNVAIAKSFKSIAFSRYLPNIIAYSDLHWTNPNPYNSLEEEFGRSWQIGVTAQMEIFHWNERGFENKSAQHKQKAAEYMLKDVSEKILVEIKKSKLELQEAWKRTEITTRSLQQSEENLRIVHEKFAEGLLKSSDLLDAQILWQKAHSDNIDARSDYNLSYYAYQKALGNRYYE
jgi:outer membrane protein TolC